VEEEDTILKVCEGCCGEKRVREGEGTLPSTVQAATLAGVDGSMASLHCEEDAV
jgi:hypothetical protein